jgi:hypothetical protein
MSQEKPFTWIVRFDVAPVWVADGGTISDFDALNMLGNQFGDACQNTEIAACVLSGPSRARIAAAQGYSATASHHRTARADIYQQLADEAPVAMSPDRYSMLRLVLDLEGVARDLNHPGLIEGLVTLKRAMNGSMAISDIGVYPDGEVVNIRGIECNVRATPALNGKK